MFAFSKLSAAKQKQVGGDLGFVVDSAGNIHASSWNGQTPRDPSKAQSVNDLVHDWYSQQIASRQQAFLNEQGQMSTSAVLPSALERQMGRRIKRRGIRENVPDWMGRQLTPEEAGLEDWKKQYKPFGRPMLYPIPLPQEWRQKFMDVVEYPQLGLLSWVAKLLIGGTSNLDKVIRAHRTEYNETIKSLSQVRNRRKSLGELYVSPGEEKARKEDYKKLNDYLGNQQWAAGRSGDKTTQNKYLEQIDQLRELNPIDDDQWKQINDMYVGYNLAPQTEKESEHRAISGLAQMPTQHAGQQVRSQALPQVGFETLTGAQHEEQPQPQEIQPLIDEDTTQTQQPPPSTQQPPPAEDTSQEYEGLV